MHSVSVDFLKHTPSGSKCSAVPCLSPARLPVPKPAVNTVLRAVTPFDLPDLPDVPVVHRGKYLLLLLSFYFRMSVS